MAPAARRPKRKATATKDGTSKSVAKRVKIPNDKRKETRSQVHRSEVINKPPTDVLTVLVFGDGENAELGLGPNKTESKVPRVNPFLDPNDRSKFHIVHLACGGMHTVALTADGQIITWGVNDGAALGRDTAWDGDLRDMDSESDDEVGDLNPLESTPTAVSPEHFEPGVRFAQVAAGDNCTFALTTTGLVYGWGTFRNAQGHECFRNYPSGSAVEKQTTPILIPGIRNIVQIACETNHVLALDKSGNIWGWGSNDELQLGRKLFGRDQNSLVPHQIRVCRNKAVYIASGECHSFAVDKDDNVWAWGRNSNCETGHDPRGNRPASLPYPVKVRGLCGSGVKHLSGGANHSVAVAKDGRCFAWGRMDTGQLGIEFTAEQLNDESLIQRSITKQPQLCIKPTLVPRIGYAAFVACGSDHTIFVDADGKVYSSGFNLNGQLGLDSTDDVPVAQQIIHGSISKESISCAGAGGRFSMIRAIYK